jgi:hypothetical protein
VGITDAGRACGPSWSRYPRRAPSAVTLARRLAGGHFATELTGRVWPVRVCRQAPPRTSHTRTVSSTLPDTAIRPSADNATDSTWSVWPVKVCCSPGGYRVATGWAASVPAQPLGSPASPMKNAALVSGKRDPSICVTATFLSMGAVRAAKSPKTLPQDKTAGPAK